MKRTALVGAVVDWTPLPRYLSWIAEGAAAKRTPTKIVVTEMRAPTVVVGAAIDWNLCVLWFAKGVAVEAMRTATKIVVTEMRAPT
jgi:hypothetical protein